MNSSNLPKPMSPREWRRYKERQRQREAMLVRRAAVQIGIGGEEQRLKIIAEAQRNSRKGWATSFPAVGIPAVRKSKWRAL